MLLLWRQQQQTKPQNKKLQCTESRGQVLAAAAATGGDPPWSMGPLSLARLLLLLGLLLGLAAAAALEI
jgi:hypothetical protein